MATPPKDTAKPTPSTGQDAEAPKPTPARAKNPNLRRVTIANTDDRGSGRRSSPSRVKPEPEAGPSITAAAAAELTSSRRKPLPVDPRMAAGMSRQAPVDPRAADAKAAKKAAPKVSDGKAAKPAAGGGASSSAHAKAAPAKSGSSSGSGRSGQAKSTQGRSGGRSGVDLSGIGSASKEHGSGKTGPPPSPPRAPVQPRPSAPRSAVVKPVPAADPRTAGGPSRPNQSGPKRRNPNAAGAAAGGATGASAGKTPAKTDANANANTNAAEANGTAADQHKRPTRDSLQGEPTPGSAGARRRVVIDAQASRRAPAAGGVAGQQPRRPRRGRRRRGTYDDEAESRPTQTQQTSNVIRVNSGSTVKDVAEYFDVRVPEIMKKLMELGELKTLTQTLSDDTVEVLAAEFNREVEMVRVEDETTDIESFDDDDEDLVMRPPVVTIMGHVDHGKTSLLDAIRSTSVASGEAGGITQHIGAYQVKHGDNVVTFLDTPGHEAFTAMRARGAKATDVAVIVVAADDGVKPQTQEAVDHAREADVPIIVAVNKIDKTGADPTRVRTEMTQLGLQPVEWGGDVDFVDVSAKSKQGLDDLLDTIVTQAELMELRANPDAEASGTVIESKLDPGRGPVVTVLIARGTLHVGDAVVAGANWGRVRAMQDFTGERIDGASPGQPVEVLGFDSVPEAGEHVRVVEHERKARQLATELTTRLKSESLARHSAKRVSLEDIFGDGIKELNLLIKSDVAGSLEAISDEIAKLPQDEVSVNIIRGAVGAVTESDVMLASASEAVIMAFNVRPVGDARAVAEREGIEIRSYSVIYRAIEELRQAMQGMLAPEEVEDELGSAEVRQIFRASKIGTIAGSHVTEGKLQRGAKIRLVRDGTVAHHGEIASLRRFNEDAREVASGFDCGIVLKDFADVKEGDVIEAYVTRQVERELV